MVKFCTIKKILLWSIDVSSCPRRDCLWINFRFLLYCHPDTEIFSKRRKIYSFCVDGRDDVSDLTFRQSYQSLTSDKLVCQLRNKKLYSDTMQNTFLAFFCMEKNTQEDLFLWKAFEGWFFFYIKENCEKLMETQRTSRDLTDCNGLDPAGWDQSLSLLGLLAKIKV